MDDSSDRDFGFAARDGHFNFGFRSESHRRMQSSSKVNFTVAHPPNRSLINSAPERDWFFI
eukprot:gene12071-12160_t